MAARAESVGGANKNVDKFFTEELKQIADRDPLHDLTMQEKDLIWKIREYCLTGLPDLLPRIVDCVDYTNQGRNSIALLKSQQTFQQTFQQSFYSTGSCKKIPACLNFPSLLLPTDLGSQCTAHQP